MKYDSFKKNVIITKWSTPVNWMGKESSIYWIMKITKLNNEEELVPYRVNIRVPIFDPIPTHKEIGSKINKAFKSLQKELITGYLSIYNNFNPDEPPRKEKFSKIMCFNKIPKEYMEYMSFYYD